MVRTRKQHGSGGMISRATGMLWPPANVPPANVPPANVPPANVAPVETLHDVLEWAVLVPSRMLNLEPMIEVLLARGANINETKNGKPLIHYVLELIYYYPELKDNLLHLFTFLINHGANINSDDFRGLTLLELSLKGRFDGRFSREILSVILQNGATITKDVIIKDLVGHNKLSLLLDFTPESVKNELRNYVGEHGGNLLHSYLIALLGNYPYISDIHQAFIPAIINDIQKLLEIGINPDFRNELGQTPARLAESMGLNEIAEMLKVRPERSPIKTKNIYGLSNATIRKIKGKQNARLADAAAAAAAGVGGRRRSTRRTRRHQAKPGPSRRRR